MSCWDQAESERNCMKCYSDLVSCGDFDVKHGAESESLRSQYQSDRQIHDFVAYISCLQL